MNDEDIKIFLENGFIVPDYFKEDKYVLVNSTDLNEMLMECIKLRMEGKVPVVMILERIAGRISRRQFNNNWLNYNRMKLLTNHIFIENQKVSLNPHELIWNKDVTVTMNKRKQFYLKKIQFCFQPAYVFCDGKCELAVGMDPPRESTSEGGEKWNILNYLHFPNKWCVRECDRCFITEPKR